MYTWKLLRVVLMGLTAFALAISSLMMRPTGQAYAAPAAPSYTTSRYMSTINSTTLYNEGCSFGQLQASQGQNQNPSGTVVVLDFGRPGYQNGTYGSWIFNNSFASTASITTAAENFLQGYWNCTPYWPNVRLAIGTSNYGSSADFNAHGKAWGTMINNIASWISQKGYGYQESIAAANDMEMSWNAAAKTRSWADGYASTSSWAYYDFGDAGGCPQQELSYNGSCNNGWKQEDVWYVSWGVAPAYVLAEMYNTAGAQAKQWRYLSLYSYKTHGYSIYISGSFTQWQACQGRSCPGTNNSPSTGWAQLWDQLNADSRTAQTLRWSTDITWNN